MPIAKYFWELGSIVIAAMASLHLYYTFFSNQFSSPNEKTVEAMKTSFPFLSKEMTIWNAWISFNATHSIGGIFIGVINFYLAFQYFDILQTDPFFFLFSIATMGFFVWLGKKYWFKTPFIGVSITLVCYLVSYVLTVIG